MATYSEPLIRTLSRILQESQFVFISDDERQAKTKLSRGEFEARCEGFIKDPESGIPGDEDAIALTRALLAKRYRTHLPPAVAQAFMAPLSAMAEQQSSALSASALARLQRSGRNIRQALHKPLK